MPRHNRNRGYCQKSKKSRSIRKEVDFLKLNKNTSHPSHIAGFERTFYSIGYKPISKKKITKMLGLDNK